MTYALETQIENLRAEVNRLTNVIAERDYQIDNLKAEIEAHVNINHDNAESAAEYDGAMRECFYAARLSHPDVGLKYPTFDDYQRNKEEKLVEAVKGSDQDPKLRINYGEPKQS